MKNQGKRVQFESRHVPYTKLSKRLDRICDEQKSAVPDVLRSVIELALEIAREGREGRKIGTLFVVGEEDSVLRLSHPLILDPLQGHELDSKRIEDPNLRGTVKELAQLDGAFVISGEGHVLSAARYIDAHSENIDLPLGLGSRHVAAASITRDTKAVAVLVLRARLFAFWSAASAWLKFFLSRGYSIWKRLISLKPRLKKLSRKILL